MPEVLVKRRPPVIIVASTQRCGTTLLQRAFNSTGKVIIYGENFNIMEKFPRAVAGVTDNFNVKIERTRKSMDQLLAGQYDADLSALFPPYERYASLIRKQFYDALIFYDDDARAKGRMTWGIKNQIVDLRGFLSFVNLVPSARYIFVYRDLVAAARSMRSRFPKLIEGAAGLKAFGHRWIVNTAGMRAVRNPNVLHLEYADFIENAEKTITTLEEHTSVTGIDAAVFRRRVNVSPITDVLTEQESRSHYRPPAILTDEETDILLSLQRVRGRNGAAHVLRLH